VIIMNEYSTARPPRVVWGLDAIAKTIGVEVAQARWLISQGKLRVKKHGHRTVSALEHELIQDCAGEKLPDA
jgi:hypothetical protein